MALTAFACVAVFLTLVGLYGLIAFAVRQRTAEIGVRMALGATPGAMIRMVILSGLKLTFAGLAIGVCSKLALARGMAAFIYGTLRANLLSEAREIRVARKGTRFSARPAVVRVLPQKK